MDRDWIKITVRCKSTDVDTVSSVMSMVSTSLMVEDYSDLDTLLDGVYGDLIDESLLNADRTKASVSMFVSASSSPSESTGFIRERLDSEGIGYSVEFENINESDWENSWKQYYKPIHVSDKLVIVPAWEKYDPAPGENIVIMNPGMAFGTGTHETTRLCASLISSHLKAGDSVADLGCGSGILAITASKLGAGKCYATDIDPEAVKIAQENAIINKTDNIACFVSDLGKDPRIQNNRFHLVVANIVADVIMRLVPDVGNYLEDNGVLIVSGIIDERVDEVKESLSGYGYETIDERHENGWYAAACRRGAK